MTNILPERSVTTIKPQEWPLLFAIFLDLVGFGITFPDVQLRAQEYGAPGWVIGTILSSYYLVQMIASPQWGKFSDRIGRKPVLLLCGGLSALSMIVYALGSGVWALLASRIVAGFGAANVVTAQAYIADSTQSDGQAQRAGALARMSAAVSAGLVLGPVVGGFLAHAGGNLLLGMVAAGASGLGALWIFFAVPHRAPLAPIGGKPTNLGNPLILFKTNPALLQIFVAAVIGWFVLACLEGTFGRLIQHTLGMGQLEFGLLLALEALVAILQGAFYPAFARRVSPAVLLRAAYLLQAVGLALMPFAPNLGTLAALSVVYGLGAGIASPTINAAASALSPAEKQGEIFGLLQSYRALGFLVGPILGGILFDRNPALPYLLAGGVALTVVLFLAGNRFSDLRVKNGFLSGR